MQTLHLSGQNRGQALEDRAGGRRDGIDQCHQSLEEGGPKSAIRATRLRLDKIRVNLKGERPGGAGRDWGMMRRAVRVEQRLAQGLLSVAIGCLLQVGPAALSRRRDPTPDAKPSSLALVCFVRL